MLSPPYQRQIVQVGSDEDNLSDNPGFDGGDSGDDIEQEDGKTAKMPLQDDVAASESHPINATAITAQTGQEHSIKFTTTGGDWDSFLT